MNIEEVHNSATCRNERVGWVEIVGEPTKTLIYLEEVAHPATNHRFANNNVNK